MYLNTSQALNCVHLTVCKNLWPGEKKFSDGLEKLDLQHD